MAPRIQIADLRSSGSIDGMAAASGLTRSKGRLWWLNASLTAFRFDNSASTWLPAAHQMAEPAALSSRTRARTTAEPASSGVVT